MDQVRREQHTGIHAARWTLEAVAIDAQEGDEAEAVLGLHDRLWIVELGYEQIMAGHIHQP